MPIFSVKINIPAVILIEATSEDQIIELIDQSEDHISQEFINENDIDLQIQLSLENNNYSICKIDNINNINISNEDGIYSGKIISAQEMIDTIIPV